MATDFSHGPDNLGGQLFDKGIQDLIAGDVCLVEAKHQGPAQDQGIEGIGVHIVQQEPATQSLQRGSLGESQLSRASRRRFRTFSPLLARTLGM